MSENNEVLFWTDREIFFECGRVLQKNWRSNLGEVTFAVKDGMLRIESIHGGTAIPCEGSGEISARIAARRFRSLIAARGHEKRPSGKMPIVFRPALGEVAIDVAGVKAKFD